MFSRQLTILAFASLLPATTLLAIPANAQVRYYDRYDDWYYDRDYDEERRYYRDRWDSRRDGYRRDWRRGRSTGVDGDSRACSLPAYRMDPRCYGDD